MARCGCGGGGGEGGVCSCALVAGQGTQVAGNGSPATPYTVSVCVSPEPNGVEFGPDDCLLVAPSSEPDNVLAFGADDRLYVPSTAAGATPVTEGPGINVTGAGIPGDPWVVAADPGCGLRIGAADDIEAAVAGVWGTPPLDFPCPDTAGDPVYCDAAGQLRTTPPAAVRNAGLDVVAGAIPFPPGPAFANIVLGPVGEVCITNDSCRPMLVDFRVELSELAASISPGTSDLAFGVASRVSVNGAPYGGFSFNQVDGRSNNGTVNFAQSYSVFRERGQSIRAPGDTLCMQFQAFYRYNVAPAGNQVLSINMTGELRGYAV